MIIEINDTLKLAVVETHHSGELYLLAKANHSFLRKWLPWVGYMKSEDFILAFIHGSRQRMAAGQELAFVILKDNVIAGRIGVYKIDTQNKTGELGYWLGENYQNQGIMTQSCKALISYCFDTLGINRIEIRCAAENHQSQRIPERLGFMMEGIIRQGEWLHHHYTDLKLFSLLKHEWNTQNAVS